VVFGMTCLLSLGREPGAVRGCYHGRFWTTSERLPYFLGGWFSGKKGLFGLFGLKGSKGAPAPKGLDGV